MKSTLTRSLFLRGVLTGVVLLIAGCGDSSTVANCENYDDKLVRDNVLKKLKEKHPQLNFEIARVTFYPDGKFQFWHVKAVTDSTGQKQMIFAMHYCDGSVELTALNPYEP